MSGKTKNDREKTQAFWEKMPSALSAAINHQLHIDDIGLDEFADQEGVTYEHARDYSRKRNARLPNKTHEYLRLLRRLDGDQLADALRPLVREKGLEIVQLAGGKGGDQ